MKTVLYKLTTTFIGADCASHFYFDTRSQAELNLSKLPNGEIKRVEIESDYVLNYHAGCTLNDLTHGAFDVKETEL